MCIIRPRPCLFNEHEQWTIRAVIFLAVPILLIFLKQFFTQVLYAGLGAYAGILLYKCIIAKGGPIHFVAQPEDDELFPGTPIRLYTKSSFSLVAQGSVVETLDGASSRE